MSALAPEISAEADTDIETVLLHVWRRTLGNPDIAPGDNFFDLGGDSLLAVNLFLEVERRTGVTLPITAIYDAPTIAEMTQLVREEAAGMRAGWPDQVGPQAPAVPGAYAPLVLLKPGAGANPLFIIHGIGGTVMELVALGRAIDIPDAVYAVQAKGLDGKEAPLATIAGMADCYVQAVRGMQPAGPYSLCGYSFGGVVAMEMARRFDAAGAPIAALILIDAFAHPSTWPFVSRAKMQLRRARHLLRITAGRPPGETLRILLRRARMRQESERLHDWLLDCNPALPLPLLRVREAGGAALRGYRPTPYAGPVTFLKAYTRDTEFPDDPERIWKRIATRIEYRTIPGGHRTVVTEHAETTAAAITSCIAAARHRPAAPSTQFSSPARSVGEVVRSTGGGPERPRAIAPSVSRRSAPLDTSPASLLLHGGGNP